MAFQYNDNRPINNHTHIDYPLTCGTNNAGNVTWVDFINFRNVEGFGVEPKQSIGGTWLNVLERLQVCFDDISVRLDGLDARLTELEEGPSSITITGNTSFGSNSFITLQSSTNADWSIYDIKTSDTSNGATIPNIALADTTNTSTKVVISNEPSFHNFKGTIDFDEYQIGGRATMDENGITISATYMSDQTSSIRWEAKVKATSKTNSQVSNYKTVNKIFDNPYNNEGQWRWRFLTNPSKFTITQNGNTVSISPNSNESSFSGRLQCTNDNCDDVLTLDIYYEATTPTYTWYQGMGTEEDIQTQEYINGLSYNQVTKPANNSTLTLSRGYNVFIFPSSWGTPTFGGTLDYSKQFLPYPLDDLGITNPSGKTVSVVEAGSNGIAYIKFD